MKAYKIWELSAKEKLTHRLFHDIHITIYTVSAPQGQEN